MAMIPGAPEGCYYNFQHYGEGDRIMTNEPCLNCTCHNRMLMCYLRVCPFTKPIGQDCTVEKRADQCCPIVTCPDGKLQTKAIYSCVDEKINHVTKPRNLKCYQNTKTKTENDAGNFRR